MAATKTLSLDATVEALRRKGFKVRSNGSAHQGSRLAYDLTSPQQAFAIRFDDQLASVLAGTDRYFNPK